MVEIWGNLPPELQAVLLTSIGGIGALVAQALGGLIGLLRESKKERLAREDAKAERVRQHSAAALTELQDLGVNIPSHIWVIKEHWSQSGLPIGTISIPHQLVEPLSDAMRRATILSGRLPHETDLRKALLQIKVAFTHLVQSKSEAEASRYMSEIARIGEDLSDLAGLRLHELALGEMSALPRLMALSPRPEPPSESEKALEPVGSTGIADEASAARDVKRKVPD